MISSNLAIGLKRRSNEIVTTEDRALQGCNLSADGNSKTAGLGGIKLALAGTCGIDEKAENPRGFGGQRPPCRPPQTKENKHNQRRLE